MKIIFVGCAIVALLAVLDILWFQFAGNFFKNQIGAIARLAESGEWNVRIMPALGVYGLMALAIMVFVLPLTNTVQQAVLYGALFGFISYGIYDLTNLATLSAWTIKFAAVDMVWGSFLCATATAGAFWLSRIASFS